MKADAPRVGWIDELVSYFKERWLNRPYMLKYWNYYQMEGPKTNNHVEGWHKKINRAAGKAHPNIFELVELFKTEQANTEVSLVQLAAGGAVRNTRKKYSTKQKRLAKLGEKFERGDYTLDEYIDGISKWMGFNM